MKFKWIETRNHYHKTPHQVKIDQIEKKNNLNKLEKNNSALPLWKKIFHFELFPISRLTLLESPNMRGCDWVENSVKCVQS